MSNPSDKDETAWQDKSASGTVTTETAEAPAAASSNMSIYQACNDGPNFLNQALKQLWSSGDWDKDLSTFKRDSHAARRIANVLHTIRDMTSQPSKRQAGLAWLISLDLSSLASSARDFSESDLCKYKKEAQGASETLTDLAQPVM